MQRDIVRKLSFLIVFMSFIYPKKSIIKTLTTTNKIFMKKLFVIFTGLSLLLTSCEPQDV